MHNGYSIEIQGVSNTIIGHVHSLYYVGSKRDVLRLRLETRGKYLDELVAGSHLALSEQTGKVRLY